MPVRQPRYPMEEFARRGTEIYEHDIRSAAETEHWGEFVAIDIETGSFEIDPDDITAADKLYQRVPDAQVWLMRVGQPTAYHFGLRPVPSRQ